MFRYEIVKLNHSDEWVVIAPGWRSRADVVLMRWPSDTELRGDALKVFNREDLANTYLDGYRQGLHEFREAIPDPWKEPDPSAEDMSWLDC